ncbi:uncharacterized protein [Lolium perenne]|uniref:uncharacterized protein n=1 Tax=Lolium perenne TaxID=4522 RepID=UPI0021F53E0D|nr:J domain-containing protein required for chloroplast accumulation response 1 [Lolium perenne]
MAGAGAPPRGSDVDFADVFGGPPRRSSGSERVRRSSLDSSASRARSGAEERPVFGDRTSSGSASRARSGAESGLGDRPVFGERTSSERRQLGQEFYRDIFPGGEPMSPRRGGTSGDRDVFGAPASPGPTTPGRLRSSFSMKFSRGVDNSVPTSPSCHISNKNDDDTPYAYSVPASPNSSTSSFLAQGASQQDSKKNPFSWHRYPFLSRFRSQSGDKKDTSQYDNSMASECEWTPVGSESFTNSNKFHFSFYKWAGKGALLMLPASVQEKDGNVIGIRSFPQVVLQGIDLIDEEESMSTATAASKSQTDYEDYKSGKDDLFERKHSINSTTKDEAISLVFDEYMQGAKTKETGTKSGTSNAKSNVSAASPSTQRSRPPSGEKSRGTRVLKDFIKIFSPESSPKRKKAPEAQDQISSGKNGSKGGVEDKFSISGLETDEDIKTDRTTNRNAFSAAPSQMSEVQSKTEKPVLTVDNEMHTRTGKPAGKEDVKPLSPDESIHVETEEKVCDTIGHEESHMEDLEGCVVEQFEEGQILQDDKEKEQIKISESKIREWSRGKEGNIRSLLSTLQLVLWPESGWKPVPLVNIIEGAGVKKAYQKALLCLHPDKLQQRGAAVHQKYIAEKVFDILQEAWKEFNSVSFG